jgi:hypothetical protein
VKERKRKDDAPFETQGKETQRALTFAEEEKI